MIKKTKKIILECDCCLSRLESDWEGEKQIGGDAIGPDTPTWSKLCLTSDLRVSVELDLCSVCAKAATQVEWTAQLSKLLTEARGR
jgi:hypothetical protein